MRGSHLSRKVDSCHNVVKHYSFVNFDVKYHYFLSSRERIFAVAVLITVFLIFQFVAERAIQQRREQEATRMQTWTDNSKYFQNAAVTSRKAEVGLSLLSQSAMGFV